MRCCMDTALRVLTEVKAMASSLLDDDVRQAFAAARVPRVTTVEVGGEPREVPSPFHSPADWRDLSIYFLLVDRFSNPDRPPNHVPWDQPELRRQGGTLEGVRQRLPYLKKLGVGAIWLSPVLKNSPFIDSFYGGYCIQDFLTVEPRYTSNPDAARLDPSLGRRELRRLVDEAHGHGLYVILDIVLNHAGDVFNYEGARDSAPWRGFPTPEYTVYWRDQSGQAVGDWTDLAAVARSQELHPDAAVWPRELQRNDYFRRRGADGPDSQGDFWIFKELVTAYLDDNGRFPVRDLLIRIHQYLVAEYDVDGFRIDTLMYIERETARVFGNAVREHALAIGKRNFFTFGEVWQEGDQADEAIAQFIGRNTGDRDQIVGVDAALDFPVFRRLRDVCRGFAPPSDLAGYSAYRQDALRQTVSSHGDAGRFFVTFLDNHDLDDRFNLGDPARPELDRQHTLALTCLLTLQGVPCLYYGEEQGLCGRGASRESVREALWGKPDAFDTGHPFFRHIRALNDLRAASPPLRYGRQYFRPISGDGVNFGISPYPGGVLAYSRILNDEEILVVANTSVDRPWTGSVVVDSALHSQDAPFQVLLSNHDSPTPPQPATTGPAGASVRFDLRPMEAQVVGRG